jgi:hypothetical protein
VPDYDSKYKSITGSRQGKDVLPMRHWRENVLLDPLTIEKHALLMTARTEIACVHARLDIHG